MLKLRDDYAYRIWQNAFTARATVVVQDQKLYFSAEQCADFADLAVKEYQKRLRD